MVKLVRGDCMKEKQKLAKIVQDKETLERIKRDGPDTPMISPLYAKEAIKTQKLYDLLNSV